MADKKGHLKLTSKDGKLTSNGIYRTKERFAGWTSMDVKIFWDIDFTNTGRLEVEFFLGNIGQEAGAVFELTLQTKNKTTSIRGTSSSSGGYFKPKPMPMGFFEVDVPGKAKLTVQAVLIKNGNAGDLYHVLLTGPASVGAKAVDVYALKADSVHLTPDNAKNALMYYDEVIVNESFPATYFCACVFDNAGYIGIQEVDFEGQKIAIFSLWDNVDQEEVPDCDEAQLAQCSIIGEGVTLHKFGSEGTGYKTMYPFQWEVKQKIRFLLMKESSEDGYVTYTGFVYLPEKQQWKLLAKLKRVGKSSQFMNDYYTFVEDWEGAWGHVAREASFDPWVRRADGKWEQTKTVNFSKAGDNKEDHTNAWEENGRFFMRTGGETTNTIQSQNNVLHRTISDEIPQQLRNIDNIIKSGKYLP